MTRFEEIKNNRPHLLCTCGHAAGDHLYCGDHLCILCECDGYHLDAALENIPIAVERDGDPVG
jgi:hypothetical protein